MTPGGLPGFARVTRLRSRGRPTPRPHQGHLARPNRSICGISPSTSARSRIFHARSCAPCAASGPARSITYGELAKQAGKPGAARAVGRIMGANPVPVIVPCHRCLGADGSLTGFSAAGGTGTQGPPALHRGLRTRSRTRPRHPRTSEGRPEDAQGHRQGGPLPGPARQTPRPPTTPW